MNKRWKEKKSRYAVIALLCYSFVYATQIIYNVIDVLRTIAFMGLKRNCPLNHDRLCRFLLGCTYPRRSSLSFLFRHSHDLPIFRISPTDRKSAGGNATRRGDFRVFQCPTDNLFVAKNGQKRTELGGRGPFAPSCRRTGLPTIPYVVRRLNETMRWIDSPTRMRPFPPRLLSSRVSHLFPFFPSDGGQEQPLPEPSNLCPKTKNSFGLLQHTQRSRKDFRYWPVNEPLRFLSHGLNIIQII